MSFKGKIKDSIYWWLSRSRPFFIDDLFKVELLFVDKINNTAKIQVTNLKTNEVTSSTAEVRDEQ